MWERAHYFETSRGRPFTFITSMARNRAIDKLRAKQRAARNRDALEEHNRIAEFLTDADASDEAFAHEAGGYLRSAVMRLPEVQRRAIELVYFNELTQREAAEITGAPVGTIKARVRRGIAQLGGLLPKDQF
ncbi:MAG: sigma-70 family RNA polymerase sigma factor [Verrucomicrobiales bacterium]